MKKIIALVVLCVVLVVALTACEQVKTGNRITFGKDVQTFTYCYIALGNTKITQGYITQWRDYSNSDVVQVLVDGKYYLTHYSNVIMIADPSQGALGYSDPNVFGADE